MYPKIKRKKKSNKIKDYHSKIGAIVKSFFGSLKTPKRFIRFIKKTFHF